MTTDALQSASCTVRRAYGRQAADRRVAAAPAGPLMRVEEAIQRKDRGACGVAGDDDPGTRLPEACVFLPDR